jgi:hypothetical protein
MIKLHYRPPEIRDQTQAMPFVPGAAPLCSDHKEAAETCSCGMPDDVRPIVLRSVMERG